MGGRFVKTYVTDITELSRMLTGRVLSVCEHLLPGGRAHGGEYEAGDIDGGPGKSLKVRLTGDKAGVWADFADGKSGDLIDLWRECRRLGMKEAIIEASQWLGVDMGFKTKNNAREYSRPDPIGESLFDHPDVWQYLKRRGLTEEALKMYRVRGKDNRQMVFPYMRDGVLYQQKRIDIQRDQNGKKRISVDKDCKPCLYGWPAIPSNAREVTICEGEIDAISLWMLGFPALSVPFGGGTGAKQQWIEHEWENLAQFETIYLAMDMDEEGQAAANEIAGRLGLHRTMIVALPRKDANECLLAGDDVSAAFNEARTIDPDELKNASEFLTDTLEILAGSTTEASGYETPWASMSQKLRFRPFELTVWSGQNGHGKSLLLGQVLIHQAHTDGIRCCVASLEMKPSRTLSRMVRQSTGLRFPIRSHTERVFSWMQGWLWLVDLVGTAKIERLLDTFTYAYKRYGITAFVIDSLAKLGLAEDDYNGQKALIEKLCDFVNLYPVHVHLVAHARKQHDESKPTGKHDVKGTGAITDLAWNEITVWRNKPKEEKLQKGSFADGPDALLICDKQRNHDWEGRLRLFYDPDSMLYLEDGQKLKQYVGLA